MCGHTLWCALLRLAGLQEHSRRFSQGALLCYQYSYQRPHARLFCTEGVCNGSDHLLLGLHCVGDAQPDRGVGQYHFQDAFLHGELGGADLQLPHPAVRAKQHGFPVLDGHVVHYCIGPAARGPGKHSLAGGVV